MNTSEVILQKCLTKVYAQNVTLHKMANGYVFKPVSNQSKTHCLMIIQISSTLLITSNLLKFFLLKNLRVNGACIVLGDITVRELKTRLKSDSSKMID